MSRTLKAAAGIAVLALLWAPEALASLTRQGTALLVGSGASGEEHPDVAYDNKNNYYLVVRGDGGAGGKRPVWAQLVNASGAMVGPQLQLSSCGGELYGGFPK